MRGIAVRVRVGGGTWQICALGVAGRRGILSGTRRRRVEGAGPTEIAEVYRRLDPSLE